MSGIVIDIAIKNLYDKISVLQPGDLTISSYNKRYFKDYIDNYYFFMPLYKQLLQKSLKKLNKPIKESVFVDYGGGCGILSFLAVELGFKSVIYNDIYDVSTKDVQLIAKEINAPIQHFVTGGIKELNSYLIAQNLQIDLLCSFDVLEHIYNLDDWFVEFKKIKGSFHLCFMTSANGNNPYKNRVLKKIHRRAEYVGRKKVKGWKERDSNDSFLAIRKKIIAAHFPTLNSETIDILSKQTRGLYKPDIINIVNEFKETGVLNYKIKHKTNTCDPMTGNWAEHIIHLSNLKSKIESNHYKVSFTNSFYSYSNNKLFNIPKYIINKLIRFLGDENLFLSPTYTLEIAINK